MGRESRAQAVTARQDSIRRILFATSAVGGASVVNIGLSLVRLKVAALVLGAAGIGLIGLLQSVVGTGAAIGGLGIGQSATREISAGRAIANDKAPRQALFITTATLVLASTLLVWLLRQSIAASILGDESLSTAVGWMALGVGLSILTASQTALLAGAGRVADIARSSLVTAVLSTTLAVGALVLVSERAIVPYLLSVPIAGAAVGWFYASRAGLAQGAEPDRTQLAKQVKMLTRLGLAIMLSSVASNLAQLAVRSILTNEVGLVEVGLYQAASTISVTYLGFVLAAMGADFFPRLSALPPDSVEYNRLINDQTEIALLLGGPVILAMIGLAGLVLHILYSSEFSAAAPVLRWQMLGDVLRLASWPLGFALLASRRIKTYAALEILAFASFVAITWLLVPTLGVEAAGIAFAAMYLLYLPLVYLLVRRAIPFTWKRSVSALLLLLIACGLAVTAVAAANELSGALAGSILALLALALAWNRLRQVFAKPLGSQS